MAIDNEMVRKIAFLSRLKIEDNKLENAKDEFNKIFKWIEELNEIDTSNVSPMASANDVSLKLREDAVTDGNYKDEILKNAPSAEYDYFAVPKVVE